MAAPAVAPRRTREILRIIGSIFLLATFASVAAAARHPRCARGFTQAFFPILSTSKPEGSGEFRMAIVGPSGGLTGGLINGPALARDQGIRRLDHACERPRRGRASPMRSAGRGRERLALAYC